MKRALHSRAARWTQGVLASTCRANSDVRPARLRSLPAEMHIAFQRPLISCLLASSAHQGTVKPLGRTWRRYSVAALPLFKR